MAKYLTTVTETYRVGTDLEAREMIEQAKASNTFILSKYSSQAKERKVKGEVVDSWYKVTLVKLFNDEKEPIDEVEVFYE